MNSLFQNPYYVPVDPERDAAYKATMQGYASPGGEADLMALAGSRGLEDEAAQLAEQQQLAQHIRSVPQSHSAAAGIANGLSTGLLNGMNLYRAEQAYRQRPEVMGKLTKIQQNAMKRHVAPYAPGAPLGKPGAGGDLGTLPPPGVVAPGEEAPYQWDSGLPKPGTPPFSLLTYGNE